MCSMPLHCSLAESVAIDVLSNGGLSIILSAMKKYSDDVEMQDSACRAVGSLAACGKSHGGSVAVVCLGHGWCSDR